VAELLKLVPQLDPGRDPLYSSNPHAGLIVCRIHLNELQDYGVEPMANVIDPAWSSSVIAASSVSRLERKVEPVRTRTVRSLYILIGTRSTALTNARWRICEEEVLQVDSGNTNRC